VDIRLKIVPFEWEGKTYQICCNMNVLADVQEAFDGDLEAALGKRSLRGVLEFLAAMLNDAAASAGWPERFTAKGIGRSLSVSYRRRVTDIVMGLVLSSCAADEPDSEAGEEKNAQTSQGAAESTLAGT
jgi:hypothetical protein